MVSTAARLQRPAPARSVSSTCDSNESSTLHTLAIPPCAYAVLASSLAALVSTVTLPIAEALIAKIKPAIPPPITRKSLPSGVPFFILSARPFPCPDVIPSDDFRAGPPPLRSAAQYVSSQGVA